MILFCPQAFTETVKTTTDPDKKVMQEKQLATLTKAVAEMEAAVKSGDGAAVANAQKSLLVDAKDLLSDWLDKSEGSGVTDNAIFSKLPKYWEEKYHEDMEALNVRTLQSCLLILMTT